MIAKANKYLQYFFPIFHTRRTKEIFKNPATATRKQAESVSVQVYQYNAQHLELYTFNSVEPLLSMKDWDGITWINIDGIKQPDIEMVCRHFNVHQLILEDILSVGQRPKMDDIEGLMYCLLNMLYFNNSQSTVEHEQVSIVMGKQFVITFQEDAHRDVFNIIRERLKQPGSKLRNSAADYLCYALIDTIVDNYYMVLEALGERIETLEEEIIRYSNVRSLAQINMLRKELIVLKRNIAPVRDLVNGFIRSDSDLLQERTTKYFKDIYDHIVQENDLVENYRDMMMNLQDLYLSKVNLKMNEVMKVMAIVTCLLAPATVIGGIFGMNFDRIPWLHHQHGFYIAVGLMFLIPLWMIWIFRRRGWF